MISLGLLIYLFVVAPVFVAILASKRRSASLYVVGCVAAAISALNIKKEEQLIILSSYLTAVFLCLVSITLDTRIMAEIATKKKKTV